MFQMVGPTKPNNFKRLGVVFVVSLSLGSTFNTRSSFDEAASFVDVEVGTAIHF